MSDIEVQSRKTEMSDLIKRGKMGGKVLAIIRENSGPTPVVLRLLWG